MGGPGASPRGQGGTSRPLTCTIDLQGPQCRRSSVGTREETGLRGMGTPLSRSRSKGTFPELTKPDTEREGGWTGSDRLGRVGKEPPSRTEGEGAFGRPMGSVRDEDPPGKGERRPVCTTHTLKCARSCRRGDKEDTRHVLRHIPTRGSRP